MTSIIDNVLVGIGVLASLATVITAILPLIHRYIYRQKLNPQAKARQQKFTRISVGIFLISTIVILILVLFFQPIATTPVTAQGTLVFHTSDSGATYIKAVAWSPDSSRIVSVDSNDGTIQVWEALTGNLLLTYQPPGTDVSSLSWSPGGRYLAVNFDSQLQILEVDPTIIRSVFTLDSPLLNDEGTGIIAWSPDGTRIAIACADKSLRILNVSNGKVITKQKALIYTNQTASIYALAWSPNQQFIASINDIGMLQIWDASKENQADLTINTGSNPNSNLIWAPNGLNLAFENSHGIVSIWSHLGNKVASVSAIGSNSSNFPSGVTIAWSPDSQALGFGTLVGNYNGGVQVVNLLADGTLVDDFTTNVNNSMISEIWALAWSPNGNYIAGAAGSGGLQVWQARGVDSNFAQILQSGIENPLISLIKLEVIGVGIPTIGLIVLEIVFPNRERFRLKPKKTRRKTLLSFLWNVALFLPSTILTLALAWYILRAIASLTSTIFGLFFGCMILLIITPPLVFKRYILPASRRRDIRKKAQHYIKDGDIYVKQTKFQKAMESYDNALALDPNNAKAHAARGEILAKQEEYRWAIEEYDKAIALRENVAAGYFLRGSAYLALKEYQHAIEDYNRAVELAPDDAYSYFNRGLSYLGLKNASQARIDFIHASNLSPTDIDYAWKAAWAAMGKQRDNSQEIADRLEQVALINPQHSLAFVCRGVALGLRNKVAEGLKEIEKGIALDSKNWDALFWKGMLFFYHYKGAIYMGQAKAMVEQSIVMGLPLILLLPLLWLEKDRPDLFVQYAKSLLQQHDILIGSI